ncbi:MAG TPA: hypothetical protein VF043_31030 [Ktedonobacteraceae bacterium]
MTQEVSHHGRLVREYRETRVGITQVELAHRIGKSRRTVVTLEQMARIDDLKLRRTVAWTLQIPPALLGPSDIVLPESAVLTPVAVLPASESKKLSRIVLDTFNDNLRMRLDLYYLGGSVAADKGLNAHIEELTQLVRKGNVRDHHELLTLLSHNYQVKGMIARDQLDFETAETCFKQASLLAQEAQCPELNALTMARQAVMYMWQKRLDEANQLYEAAREISRRSPPALRVYLATGHAEIQGILGDKSCLKEQPEAVNVHDFPQDALGKAIPYGIYDVERNCGSVYVGSSADTPECAVAALVRWWEEQPIPMPSKSCGLRRQRRKPRMPSSYVEAALARALLRPVWHKRCCRSLSHRVLQMESH